MKNKIGIIDSGVGGLLVLDACVKAHPEYDFVFVGDQLHAPYGERTKEQMFHDVSIVVSFLQQEGITDIIIACNTICANIFTLLTRQFPKIYFYNIITPTIKQIPKHIHHKLVVLSTNATAQSHVYRDVINDFDSLILVEEIACPEFVPLIENNADKKELYSAVMKKLKGIECDGLILGCTHFPYLKRMIQNCINVPIYDSNNAIIINYPWKLTFSKEKGSIKIYSTLDGNKMEKQIHSLLNQDWEAKTLKLDF